MVHAQINISEHANRVITVIKARDGLKDKSEAIEKMVDEYENKILMPQLRPAFEKAVLASEKSGGTRYHNAREAMKDICK